MLYGPEGGLWLSERGSVKRNWEWVDDTAFIQPLVLSLNANITLKITSQVYDEYNTYAYAYSVVDHLWKSCYRPFCKVYTIAIN